jgi:hypothetical protein
MKTMDSGMWQGTNHSNSRSYCEDEHCRHGTEGAFHVMELAKQSARGSL